MTTADFLADLQNRRGLKSGGFNSNWFLELTGAKLLVPTAFEPDASTYRGDYYYNAVTNTLYRKIVTRREPGMVVAHWQKASN